MLPAALVALAAFALPAIGAAQGPPSSATAEAAHAKSRRPARPNARPVIVINASDYLSSAAKPRQTPPPNRTHADPYPGQQTFGSQSTDDH
jgi:hypothetical protein